MQLLPHTSANHSSHMLTHCFLQSLFGVVNQDISWSFLSNRHNETMTFACLSSCCYIPKPQRPFMRGRTPLNLNTSATYHLIRDTHHEQIQQCLTPTETVESWLHMNVLLKMLQEQLQKVVKELKHIERTRSKYIFIDRSMRLTKKARPKQQERSTVILVTFLSDKPCIIYWKPNTKH